MEQPPVRYAEGLALLEVVETRPEDFGLIVDMMGSTKQDTWWERAVETEIQGSDTGTEVGTEEKTEEKTEGRIEAKQSMLEEA